jgi:uncharacterized protein YqjF (DUF2071 family)
MSIVSSCTVGDTARTFLTAEWRYLAMLTFETEAALLRPFVPRGTELDTHNGRALLSLVGFRFLRTRVLGCRVPFHQDFDEVNLRFYVRREVQGELRHGVTFIREIVPRRLITLVARSAYNEPYVTLRMHSDVPPAPVAAPGRIRYAWRCSAGWQSLALTAMGAPRLPDHGTEYAFISEHHWGYTRQRDGSTLEYRVEHDPWRLWVGADAAVPGDTVALHGGVFARSLSTGPTSAFLAQGSSVTLTRPRRLGAASDVAFLQGAA